MGLRRTEARSLWFSDLTSDGLVVRMTKIGKSTRVSPSDSTCDAVNRYLGRRKKLCAAGDLPFALSTGKAISPETLKGMFIKLAHAAGLRGGKSEAGIALLDLRSRFAVRSLEQAIDTDRDNISRRILAVSTYTGNVSVDSTHCFGHHPLLVMPVGHLFAILPVNFISQRTPPPSKPKRNTIDIKIPNESPRKTQIKTMAKNRTRPQSRRRIVPTGGSPYIANPSGRSPLDLSDPAMPIPHRPRGRVRTYDTTCSAHA